MYYIVDESTNDILYAPNMQNDLKYNLIDPTWTEEINKAGLHNKPSLHYRNLSYRSAHVLAN